MPERMIRAAILGSEKINKLSLGAEVFFRRLMSIADDFGRYDARASILRAQLYALRLDKVSEKDIYGWIKECAEVGSITLYQIAGKPFLEIIDFGQRLRAQRSKWPGPDEGDLILGIPVEPGSPPLQPAGNRPQMTADAGRPKIEKLYAEIDPADPGAIRSFILTYAPGIQFMPPYIDLWNQFASKYKFPKVKDFTTSRKKKLEARLKEPAFILTKILYKASLGNDFLFTGSWFSFDWIISNDKNYLKILEGNYDKKDAAAAGEKVAANGLTAQQIREQSHENHLNNGANKPE